MLGGRDPSACDDRDLALHQGLHIGDHQLGMLEQRSAAQAPPASLQKTAFDRVGVGDDESVDPCIDRSLCKFQHFPAVVGVAGPGRQLHEQRDPPVGSQSFDQAAKPRWFMKYPEPCGVWAAYVQLYPG